MSKARKALKYSAATAVTLTYGSAIYKALTDSDPKDPEVQHRKVVVIALATIGMTWLAAIL